MSLSKLPCAHCGRSPATVERSACELCRFGLERAEADRANDVESGYLADELTWRYEHTTALAAHLGRKPSDLEIRAARRVYEAAAHT